MYTYKEHTSKTKNGSFRKLHIQNKVVPIYECKEAGQQCPVYILDKYISKLPSEAVSNDIFFFRPLDKIPSNDSMPWYIGSQPVGRNTLDQKLRKMCQMAGIDGNISNHSLRATSATHMFQMGVPERVIQERTGHRTVEALRTYERTSEEQHQAVSNVLSSSTSTPPYQYQPNSQVQKLQCQQIKASSSNIIPASSCPFTFENLHGCTINIYTAPQSPLPKAPASSSTLELTSYEMEQFLKD